MLDTIKLSIADRQILLNQYKILKSLKEIESDTYSQYEKILEAGYELHYQDLFENISVDTMSCDECREVLDIFEMFSSMLFSYKKLERDGLISEPFFDRLRFAGFDGNNETKYLYYARFFLIDLERYDEIKESVGKQFDYNSHCQMLPSYRDMLRKWNKIKSIQNSYLMTLEQLEDLISVYRFFYF